MSALLTHIDLFAGVGGFTLGFEAAGGFQTRLLVDSDRSAVQTFKRNRPRVPYWPQNLSTVEGRQLLKLAKLRPGDLDVLTAGPPCQGLSKIGTRRLDDPRNQLLNHTAELLEELQPKLGLIENVPALYWDGQSELFDELSTRLHEAGYRPHPEVVEAWRYGVPQLRRRLFILVVRDDVPFDGAPFPPWESEGELTGQELIRTADAGEPRCPPGLSVDEAIGDLPAIEAGGGAEAMVYQGEASSDYQRARRRNAKVLFNHRARTHSPAMLAKIRMIEEGGRNQDLPDQERLRADPAREYFSQAYARLHRGGIAQTITTYFHNPGSGRFIHYRDTRSITVREAARFQSFDDDFMFTGKAEQQMRHVGNAVPVLLARSLAKHLHSILAPAVTRAQAACDAAA